MATLGQNLRRLREEAGYETQVDFARELGVGSQAVSDWENDRRETVELSTVLHWAKVLKRPVEDFVLELDEEYTRLGLSRSVSGESTNGGTKKGGAPDVIPASAQARIRELEQDLDDLKTAIGKSAVELSNIAGDERLRTARTLATGRRQKTRKAG